MNFAQTTSTELLISRLRQEEEIRRLLERSVASSVRTWELPVAYMCGLGVTAIAYFAEGNFLIAAALGSGVAALSVATACFVAAKSNKATLEALVHFNAVPHASVVDAEAQPLFQADA